LTNNNDKRTGGAAWIRISTVARADQGGSERHARILRRCAQLMRTLANRVTASNASDGASAPAPLQLLQLSVLHVTHDSGLLVGLLLRQLASALHSFWMAVFVAETTAFG